MEEEYGWVAAPRPLARYGGPAVLWVVLAWRLPRPCREAALR
jgi:hypothetical protein